MKQIVLSAMTLLIMGSVAEAHGWDPNPRHGGHRHDRRDDRWDRRDDRWDRRDGRRDNTYDRCDWIPARGEWRCYDYRGPNFPMPGPGRR